MDTLAHLRLFLQVAELGSFTAAAEQSGLTRAGASAAIAQLERQLGTRLLHRTTRRVSLTQDGLVARERAADLLADADELQALFQAQPAQLRGRLRVDLPVGTARVHVMPKLPAFLAEHPGLSLELSCTDRRVDPVREGFDCVLRIGPLSDSSLVARPLGHLPLINAASPAYLARHGHPRTLADLRAPADPAAPGGGHRLVHYAPTLGARADAFEVAHPDGRVERIELPGALTVNNTEAYLQAALAGLGLVQLPGAGVLDALADGRLVRVLPGLEPAPMAVTLLVPHRRQMPRRVRVFMDWLAGLLAPHLLPVAGAPPTGGPRPARDE